MKITHLVTNGCSWTYAQGLKNIKEEGWPTLLANKLGCEVVNLALPGSGNESITRRNYEYVYENLPFNSTPLFVVVFSQLWRREVWMHNYYGTPTDDYVTMFPASQRDGNPAEKAWLHEFNEEDFLRKNMLIKFATKNLLDNHRYPYIITDFPGDDIQEPFLNKVKNRFPNWYYEYKKINDVTTLSSLVSDLDKTECSHPGPKSQIVIANFLYQSIIKKYQEIELENKNFLKLSDFKLCNENNYLHNNKRDWL